MSVPSSFAMHNANETRTCLVEHERRRILRIPVSVSLSGGGDSEHRIHKRPDTSVVSFNESVYHGFDFTKMNGEFSGWRIAAAFAIVLVLVFSSIGSGILVAKSSSSPTEIGDSDHGSKARALSSTDTWTKKGIVLDWGPLGAWDSNEAHSPCVLHDGSVYKMWYTGSGAPFLAIGYATSSDGVSWTKPDLGIYSYNGNTHNNIVLATGLVGSWSNQAVAFPCVMKEGGTYKMWFTGNSADTWMIGFATSTDGIHWTEYNNNPVMVPGDYWWESTDIYGPSVVNDGGTYRMWYTGVQGYIDKIGYAYSNDGIEWTKYPNVVIMPGPDSWDAGETSLPQVIKTSTGFEMWYSGEPGIDIWTSKIGYAVSSDGTTWTKKGVNLDLGTAGMPDSYRLAGQFVLRNSDGSSEMYYSGADTVTNRLRIQLATSGGSFYEDFNRYSSIDDPNFQSIWTMWKPSAGYGSVSTSLELAGIGDNVLRCDVTNAPSTATCVDFEAKDAAASDFSLDFDLKDFNRGSGGPTLVMYAGIDFRADNQNCYRFAILYSQELNGIRETLLKIPDRHSWPQHPTILGSTSWRTPSFPQTHHYRIECIGSSISAFSDFAIAPIITATDTSLASGYIGTYFESGNGNGGGIHAWASFDNIRLTSPESEEDDAMDVAKSFAHAGEYTYLWEKINCYGSSYCTYLYSASQMDESVLRAGWRPSSNVGSWTGFIVIDVPSLSVVTDEAVAKAVLMYCELSAVLKGYKISGTGLGWDEIDSEDYLVVGSVGSDPLFAPYPLDDKGIATFITGEAWWNPTKKNLYSYTDRFLAYKGLLMDILTGDCLTSSVREYELGFSNTAWDVFTATMGTAEYYERAKVIAGLRHITDSSLASALDSSAKLAKISSYTTAIQAVQLVVDVVEAAVKFYALDLARESYILCLKNFAAYLGNHNGDPALIDAIGQVTYYYHQDFLPRYIDVLREAVSSHAADFYEFTALLLATATGSAVVAASVGIVLFYVGIAYLVTDIWLGIGDMYHYIPEQSVSAALDRRLLDYLKYCADEMDTNYMTNAGDMDSIMALNAFRFINAEFYYSSIVTCLCSYRLGWLFNYNDISNAKLQMETKANQRATAIEEFHFPYPVSIAMINTYLANCRGIDMPLALTVSLDKQKFDAFIGEDLQVGISATNPSVQGYYSDVSVSVADARMMTCSCNPEGVSIFRESTVPFVLTVKPLSLGRYVVSAQVTGNANVNGLVRPFSQLVSFEVHVQSRSSVTLLAHSPIHLTMIDNQGRTTGWDSASGGHLEQIPYACYSGEFIDDESITFSVLSNSSYILVLTGKDGGNFGLTAIVWNNTDLTFETQWENVGFIVSGSEIVLNLTVSVTGDTCSSRISMNWTMSLESIRQFVSGLPGGCFRKPSDETQRVLLSKLAVLEKMIGSASNRGITMKMVNDIISKLEGAKPWIVDPETASAIASALRILIQFQ